MDIKKAIKIENAVYERVVMPLPMFKISKKFENNPYIVSTNSGQYDISFGFLRGIPSYLAQDALIYLFTKVPRKKDANGKTIINYERLNEEGIEFTIYEVCKALGKDPTDRKTRQRLCEELEKLAFVALHAKKISNVIDPHGIPAELRSMNGQSFIKLELYKPRNNNTQESKTLKSRLYLNPFTIYNFSEKYYQLVKFDEYMSIKTPTARRLYLLVQYYSFAKFKKLDMEKLAERIPIYTSNKHAKSTLKQALTEFENRGFIENFNIGKNSEGRDIVTIEYPQLAIKA